ncbi:hypothetical protein C8T65DRAFT_738340 [Cerioporus squamosus]|nr:hypothetical protein C8T65DRAFT_738340 [Cerioporus squamosus]
MSFPHSTPSSSNEAAAPSGYQFELQLAGFLSQIEVPPTISYKADEYIMHKVPGHNPMSEAELKDKMKMIGATDANVDIYTERLNQAVQYKLGSQGPGMRIIGMNPTPDENTWTVPIPKSDRVVRIWDGGMGPYGQFCLDF